MKKKTSFWLSFEKYIYRVVGRSPLPWSWIGIGAVLLVMVMSWSYRDQSVAEASSMHEVIRGAASNGDYALAQTLFEQNQDSRSNDQVLGVGTELEDIVYPENKVEQRIQELEQKLLEYPENREIYLALSDLYRQLKQTDKSDEYREKARILDPNGSRVQ